MQEEVTQRTVALCVEATRLSCRLSPQRASGALIPGQSGPWTRAS